MAVDSPRTHPEIITLETWDMSSDFDDEDWMCALCLENFPTWAKWEHHYDFEECEPPPRPPPAPRQADVVCETCHTVFRSERENDNHEPCPAGLSAARQDSVVRLAAGRIKEYFSLLKNPTNNGVYNSNGRVMSRSEIEKRISNLRRYLNN